MESHNWIHDLLLSDDHDIGSIEVSYLSQGKYAEQFDVRCVVISRMVRLLTSPQRWVMYESEQFDHPVIENYIAVVKSNNLTGD
ncbi:TPA: hypothetical protein ACRZ2U_000226 [Vibrio harveyi]